MIKMQLKGGLGNQLFQYALGRHLSIRRNTQLYLDISSFSKDPLRNYSLDAFNIPKEVAIIRRNFAQELLHQLDKRQLPLSKVLRNKRKFITEEEFEFQPRILDCPNNSVLDGYWQSEKYFKSIEPVLRNDLALASPLPTHLEALHKNIATTNSISIHVRRGDYANNPIITAYHGLCSTDWYSDAVKKISDGIKNPFFFVFSDDPDWAKNNIQLTENTVFISPSPDGEEANDLILMSKCKHNIIANSSFSWWAGWLNANPSKKIIAPAKWFSAGTNNTRDLIPQSWLRL